MPLLVKVICANGLIDDFQICVSGFVDTLPMFRQKLPHLNSYKLTALHQELVKSNYECHNAMADARALADVVHTLQVESNEVVKFSLTTSSAVDYVKRRKSASEALKVIEENMCVNKVISKSMAKKITDSGLTYSHLLKAHERNGATGISSLLSEKVNNKIRVTNRRAIVNKIVSHFIK